MGYYSRLSGWLEFSEPISEKAVQKLTDKYDCLSYGGEFTSNGWVDGGESGKMYDLEDEVQSLISDLGSGLVTIDGEIVVTGEDNTDIWRILVENSVMRTERAMIRWPDGSEFKSVY